jgi:hypothetical protein
MQRKKKKLALRIKAAIIAYLNDASFHAVYEAQEGFGMLAVDWHGENISEQFNVGLVARRKVGDGMSKINI